MAKRGKIKKIEAEVREQMKLTKPVKPVAVPAPQMLTVQNDGLSIQGAIDLTGESDISLAVNRHLERIFFVKKEDRRVNTDGDYFVVSEQVVQTMKRDKKYKVVFVEDSKGIKRQIFFLLPFTRI